MKPLYGFVYHQHEQMYNSTLYQQLFYTLPFLSDPARVILTYSLFMYDPYLNRYLIHTFTLCMNVWHDIDLNVHMN